MEWYPTPSYLVKRQVILDYLVQCPGRTVLEVGCGCGDLLHALSRKGYSGLGIDISEDALQVARRKLSCGGIDIVCGTPDVVSGQFDVVIASEVMEHCHDDAAFIRQLRERLTTEGVLLLTVPAHMADWDANDDLCGHIRRYERSQLYSLLSISGFDNIVIYSYGVPVYNIMKPLYDRAIRSKSSKNNAPLPEKTAESGGMWLLRSAGFIFRMLFNDITMMPFYLMQRFFYGTEYGKGYFIAARKKEM